jgi:hypothetical protein
MEVLAGEVVSSPVCPVVPARVHHALSEMDDGYRPASARTEGAEAVLVPVQHPLRRADAVVHDPAGFRRLGERFGTG